jgi:hypothetical protein
MYYPKSQIKPNLYTNGGEYILLTTKQDYKGYYYEISTGQRFTGKTPQDGPNIILLIANKSLFKNPLPTNPVESFPIELIDDESNLNYFKLQLSPLNIRALPQPIPTLPTSQDQQNGQFTRYFCKRNNELKYLEISKTTYTELSTQAPQIAWDLYTPVSLTWQITGNKNQVYASNKASAIAIEQNLRWPGFSQYFQDKFLKYYVES